MIFLRSIATACKNVFDAMIGRKELNKWEKAAELAKKDKNYLQFINEINNESTAKKETIYLLSSHQIRT